MRSSNLFGFLGIAASLMATPAQATSDRISRPAPKINPSYDDLPRGYSGAKLARKAMQGKVGKAAIR